MHPHPEATQVKWGILVTTQRRIEDLKNIYDWVFCENSEKLLTVFQENSIIDVLNGPS